MCKAGNNETEKVELINPNELYGLSLCRSFNLLISWSLAELTPMFFNGSHGCVIWKGVTSFSSLFWFDFSVLVPSDCFHQLNFQQQQTAFIFFFFSGKNLDKATVHDLPSRKQQTGEVKSLADQSICRLKKQNRKWRSMGTMTRVGVPVLCCPAVSTQICRKPEGGRSAGHGEYTLITQQQRQELASWHAIF